MFSPQTMGEHFMQNSVLFGMLRSHKIVELDDEVKGLKYGFMNKNEYVAYKEAKILNELLTEEQLDKLAQFKESIKKDAQTVADYAWWKKDVLAEFIALNLDKDERDAYIKAVEAKREEFVQEFEDKQDMWSQIELGEDGYASFVEGSKLAELEWEPGVRKFERVTDSGNLNSPYIENFIVQEQKTVLEGQGIITSNEIRFGNDLITLDDNGKPNIPDNIRKRLKEITGQNNIDNLIVTKVIVEGSSRETVIDIDTTKGNLENPCKG
jgi:hypothetical protein